ncbi:MAG: amidohydrolase family protein [Gemmatimonadales bacterium]
MKVPLWLFSAVFSLWTFTLSACGGGAPPPRVAAAPDPTIAIIKANLWDGTGREPVSNAVILVRGDRILCAGAAGECLVPTRARIIDAQGQWLIPGLVDSHVHLLFMTAGSAGQELPLDLRNLLAQGVTAVRDMGTNPAALMARVNALTATPRVYAMQLVAGRRFFFGGFRSVRTARGTVLRQPPAMTMQGLGWTPFLYNQGDDPDSLVAAARKAGASGLKLYAQLDVESVAKLTAAAHRVGMPVWGHAWVQPASALEQALAGQDGVVHAAGLAGELFSVEERDTLVNDGNLQVATAEVATVGAAHDPRILAALDSMARRGTFFEPTLDATHHSVAHFNAKRRHIPSEQENYVRAASGFGIEVTRQAVRRGVRISAGSDHVSYGPAHERPSLFGELRLLVDSVAFTPRAALLAATRDAALAIGGEAARRLGTIEAGRYADLVLLSKNPLEDIDNLDSVEWVMIGGRMWRPGQLRSGIATN